MRRHGAKAAVRRLRTGAFDSCLLHPGFQASRTINNMFLLFKSPGLCYLVSRALAD